MSASHAADPTQGQALSVAAKTAALASDIKLAHSVFALPFALIGALLAADDAQVPIRTLLGQLTLIVVCMVAARTWAMVVNRMADRRFDARNARTAGRAFASGKLDPKDGWIALAVSAFVFLMGTAGFWVLFGNPWPLAAAPALLAWLAFYSFTKRFTAACHLVLGVALALSPIASAIAVSGLDAVSTQPNAAALWALFGMITFWVAGFDVIYALADRDFDRENRLRSLPAALGWNGAAFASLAMHFAAAGALITSAALSPTLGIAFAIATGITVALLITEHAVLALRRERGLNTAFFTLNGLVAIALGVAGVIDLVI
ncbi:MAG: 4-hydroxybenzoate octaprenyltransferase [Planctomycetota bacterium]